MNTRESSEKLSNSLLNEDFWAELDSISESGEVTHAYNNELDEESSPNKSLEGTAEADWLKEAGFEDIVHSLEGDSIATSSTSLDDLLLLSLSIPLTERQVNTVKKRYDTLRTTLIKQKGSKRGQEVVQIVGNSRQRPDVRSLFNNSDNPSNQPITIPNTDISENDGNTLCGQNPNLEVPNQMIRRSSSPNLQQMSRDRTSSTPPDCGKFRPIDSDVIHDKSTNYSLSVSKSASNVKKDSSRFSWSGYKKAFKVNNFRRNSNSALDSESNDSGIEMLSLKYKSSLRRPENQSPQQNNDKNSDKYSDTSVPEYFIYDHITAEGLGIEIETKPQNDSYLPKIITDLRLNSYVVRLEDLNSEMHKKVKTLALIELASVLDMYGLEYEKIKRRKLRKKVKKNSDNGIFGTNLIDLYNLDRKRHNNCSIPSILQILINYIRINGLHEEGIFRITGSQNRVQTLKEELESLYHYYYNNSVRENHEQIFAVLNKYSIYDICSVLKHFIRELADPLLTCELLEAFLLVPKINHFLQQIQILNLLILLMSESHRNSLEAILSLLNDIVMHEHLNKMTVHNIATIMAPNLFPNLVQKKVSKGGEQKEMALMLERAKDSFILTKMLIDSQLILFHVPPYLIGQIQRRRK